MTTIRQLVTDAFREAGIIAVGSTPDADEFDEGMRRINTLIRGLFGNELGEPLKAVNFGSSGLTNSYAKDRDLSSEIESVYIPSNVRLIFNNNEAETLYLNPTPNDGARLGVIDNSGNFATYNLVLNGNGRKIELFNSVVLATNGLNREWFYRADLGNWMRVSDLVPDDQSPLPSEFDDLLTTLLAFRISTRYGAETSSETGEVLRMMRNKFRARYRQSQEQDVDMGLYRLTRNNYGIINNYGTRNNYGKSSFDRGR